MHAKSLRAKQPWCAGHKYFTFLPSFPPPVQYIYATLVLFPTAKVKWTAMQSFEIRAVTGSGSYWPCWKCSPKKMLLFRAIFLSSFCFSPPPPLQPVALAAHPFINTITSFCSPVMKPAGVSATHPSLRIFKWFSATVDLLCAPPLLPSAPPNRPIDAHKRPKYYSDLTVQKGCLSVTIRAPLKLMHNCQ